MGDFRLSVSMWMNSVLRSPSVSHDWPWRASFLQTRAQPHTCGQTGETRFSCPSFGLQSPNLCRHTLCGQRRIDVFPLNKKILKLLKWAFGRVFCNFSSIHGMSVARFSSRCTLFLAPDLKLHDSQSLFSFHDYTLGLNTLALEIGDAVLCARSVIIADWLWSCGV